MGTTMRTQVRVRGLQDIKTVMNQGRRSRLGILNELAQLQRAKVRMTQERENWQKKIDLIDANLEQIAERGKQLQQLLAEEDSALDDRDGRQERSGEGIVNQERAEEAPVNRMTIRY